MDPVLKAEQVSPSDALRTPESAFHADPRTSILVVRDLETGQFRPTGLEEMHTWMADFVLTGDVPLPIRTHFETAKNLYLYSWFVFRFYPVAEQQALASLEFALREKLRQGASLQMRRQPGLSALLQRAQKQLLISNEQIPDETRRRWALPIAKHREAIEAIKLMEQNKLERLTTPDIDPEPTREDIDTDWIQILIEQVPRMRNDYAHGSSTLRHSVLHTFDVVRVLISQLFPSRDSINSLSSG